MVKSNLIFVADDLEVNKNEEAAIKIQAGYRGYVARKEVDAMKNSKNIEDPATGIRMLMKAGYKNYPLSGFLLHSVKE